MAARCHHLIPSVGPCGVDIMAEESLDSKNGYVECTQCNGDGVGCDLAQIPELMEMCSTMQSVKAGSAIECVEDNGCIQAPELPYAWEQMKGGA
jgi:hypothetical protein